MTQPVRTLDQERGLHAWAEVDRIRNSGATRPLDESAREIELRIRTSGLAAALQYEELREGDEFLIALENWLRLQFPSEQPGRRMSERLHGAESDVWIAVTAEALEYVRWLKRLSKVLEDTTRQD